MERKGELLRPEKRGTLSSRVMASSRGLGLAHMRRIRDSEECDYIKAVHVRVIGGFGAPPGNTHQSSAASLTIIKSPRPSCT